MSVGNRRGGTTWRNVFEVQGQTIILHGMKFRRYYALGVKIKTLTDVSRWLNAGVSVHMEDKSDNIIYRFDFLLMRFVPFVAQG